MMPFPRLNHITIAAILLWLAYVSPARSLAARFHNVDLSVKHENIDASPNDFALTAFLSGRSDEAGPIDSGRLVSPTGIVFNNSNPTVRRSSLAAIDGLFTGTWTAFETLDGIETSYQFSVAAGLLDAMPTGLPIITSPRNRATVGSTFDVHWTYDDNDLPGSVGLFTVNDPELQLTGLSAVPGAENALRVSTVLLAPPPQKIDELQIYRTFALASPTRIDSSPELTGDQFDIDAGFDAISTPISLTVIPEPSTLAMIAAFVLCSLPRGERASVARNSPRRALWSNSHRLHC